jgi:hypothetical protein
MRSPRLTGLITTGSVLAVAAAPASASASAPASPLKATLPGEGGGSGLAPLVHVAKIPLVRRDVRLARLIAHVRGEQLRDGYTRIVRRFTVEKLARHHRHLRRELRQARRTRRAAAREARAARGSTASPALQAIAACESGGNPTTDTGNGFYGKYQFTRETWQAVGGSGNPAAAPESEQDRRAAALYAQAGAGQWPVCGQ